MIQSGTYSYVEAHEDNSLQIKAWSIARTVKTLSIIDIFFMLLYLFEPSIINGNSFSVSDILFIILFFLPFCGYFGASKYNKILLGIYVFFNVLEIGINVYQINQSNSNKPMLYIFLNITGIIINMWIIEIVVKLIKIIKMLNIQQYNSIRNNWRPNENTVWVLY
jgi:hypothetical protein